MAIFTVPTKALDFYTKIVNKSGAKRFFGFLGSRGMELDNNETVSVFGSLTEHVSAGHEKWDGRRVRSLNAAVDAGYLVVDTSAAMFVKDSTTNDVKKLSLAGGLLGVADPSWGATNLP